MKPEPSGSAASTRRRWRTLRQLEGWLEIPMVVLGFVWLALLVAELIWGISPVLETLSTTIWIVFIADFLLRFTLAPGKWAYLKRNWLTLIALALPALRVLRAARALRAFRAVRSVRLVRIVTSLNRGMRVLGRSMSRRGFAYVLALTTLVAGAGAAGMYAFERLPSGEGLQSYAEALWWTVMLLTTIGSEYWPRTPEGRILTMLLSMYALGVLGYITAALASFFVGRDAADAEGEIAGEESIRALRVELEALRHELRRAGGGGEAAGPGDGAAVPPTSPGSPPG